MDLPVAIVGRVAFSDALLQGGHDEGVHKVTLALVCLVTISGWATENNKKGCAIIVALGNMSPIDMISHYHTHSFSPLMQSGQITPLGPPVLVQLSNARQRD